MGRGRWKNKKVAVLATETLPEVLPQILGSAPAAVIWGTALTVTA